MTNTLTLPAQTSTIIHGKLVSFYLDEDGIFHLSAKDELITPQLLEMDYQLIKGFLDQRGLKPPVLYDATHIPPIEGKVRKRLEILLEEVFSALGVVSKSKIGYGVAYIFFGLSRSKFPKKIFQTKAAASAQLMGK